MGMHRRKITAEQIRLARAALGLGILELAFLAGLTPRTVVRIENGRSRGVHRTWDALRHAFEGAGAVFDEFGVSVMQVTRPTAVLQAKGKADRADGKVRNAVGGAKDAIRDAATKI